MDTQVIAKSTKHKIQISYNKDYSQIRKIILESTKQRLVVFIKIKIR